MITSTITECKGTAIIVNPVNMKLYRNKETGTLDFVSAYEKPFSMYGEYSIDGFFKAVKKMQAVIDMNDIVLGINEKSFVRESVKFEMEEDVFLELAHVVQEKESKLSLITRTMKSVVVKYVAVDKDRKFLDLEYSGKALDNKKLEKAIKEQATEKGLLVFSIDLDNKSIKEELYGIERSVFAKNGKAVR